MIKVNIIYMDKESKIPNQSQEIKKIIEETVNKMGFSCSVEMRMVKEEGEDVVIYNIKTSESNYLIGQHGINLQSLQHLIRLIVRKEHSTRANFILDVNSYRQERNDSILRIARSMAQQALTEKRPVIMRPMSSYERRLIHLELADNESVKTESIGDGEDRRVVIKPIGII
jgi:spoIIIJ-associated protein